MAEQIALTHHERWDGHGYIGGLKGEEIPLVSRIVAVADVFDALTHQRPYKDPWPVDDAIREIEHQSGQQFDPQVVSALRQILEEDAADDDADGPTSTSGAPGATGQSQATRLPTGDESGSPARGRITRR
jgi:HD-GYP domain-containing protein (c-di-GMP phosphodiesterase class II)